ncbi:hypothetical protein COO03_11740 [Bacillus sp. AFS098217]|nr:MULTISPECIES: phage minor capsid protein [unclassified Bacillus (in: firmicutes)]PEB52505.1 hypothetical protein COO03_11740 [Bacillus sp. AFS098217]PEU16832.1 hypothetical protein CN524_03610 [Bacillus sp. AFS019443]PEU20364.1 hypothetical protein CN525_04505 [Bacillus sp. AFS014408]
MTPEQIEQLSLFVIDIYLKIEAEILYRMGIALRMDENVTNENIKQWNIEKLAQLGKLTNESYSIIAKHAKMTQKEVRKALYKAGYMGAAAQDKELQAMLPNADVVPVKKSNTIAKILLTLEKTALEAFNLVNTTMISAARQGFLDIVNETTAKVLVGLRTPQQALRETAARWAKKGIPSITDKVGRRWSTEGYVNTVIRSTSNRVANETQFARMDEYEVDLIEVSSHIDSRPGCAPYQGRIYSRSGKSKKYPPFSSTSYGEASGLLGVNCRHVIYGYIEGKNKKTYHPYPKSETDKAYKQSQQQRELERNIRRAKKELRMAEGMKDEVSINKAKQKVRDRQAKMRNFINESGRTRRKNREQIV